MVEANKVLIQFSTASQTAVSKSRIASMLPKERRVQLAPLEDALKRHLETIAERMHELAKAV
jgi:hypothetical protein